MSIINDFKGIKEAADAISKEILKKHREPEAELTVEFTPEESIAERLCVNKAPNPHWQDGQAAATQAGQASYRKLVAGQKAALPNCPRCGSRTRMKTGGLFCLDCDEYVT